LCNKAVEELKNLPGNLRPIDHNYQEASYVIHDSLTHQKVNAAIKELNRVNIYPLGRFAEWQYYNMDAAIESAMKLVSRLTAKQ
jgi:UDP-galactopyranose mutase